MNRARFWEPGVAAEVHCHLCQHHCRIRPGRRGICRTRENRDGTLYTLVYGKAVAQAVDPIEKKPLFHFLPGSRAFSIATAGGNFRCRYCQNCDLHAANVDLKFFSDESDRAVCGARLAATALDPAQVRAVRGPLADSHTAEYRAVQQQLLPDAPVESAVA